MSIRHIIYIVVNWIAPSGWYSGLSPVAVNTSITEDRAHAGLRPRPVECAVPAEVYEVILRHPLRRVAGSRRHALCIPIAMNHGVWHVKVSFNLVRYPVITSFQIGLS